MLHTKQNMQMKAGVQKHQNVSMRVCVCEGRQREAARQSQLPAAGERKEKESRQRKVMAGSRGGS